VSTRISFRRFSQLACATFAASFLGNTVAATSDAATASANGAWEDYLQAPTTAAADAAIAWVRRETESEIRNQLESQASDGLGILEYEVSAGESHAIRLAFFFAKRLANSGALAERLDQIAGRSIRTNPSAYLDAVQEIAGGNCVGVRPSGDFFVDRDDARGIEAARRIEALKAVRSTKLAAAKMRCKAILERRVHSPD
jgi:hypothetical protein